MPVRPLPFSLGATMAVLALAGAALSALAMGLPNDAVPNPWFTRMTPVRAQ